MAVLQISKIQVRRGQKTQTGIPTLSAGEFAWAIDAQELYIGNGAVSEGAPFVGNTRLLTELDANNIFKLASTYTYEGNTSATVTTGLNANSPVSRTLQDKLDDYVSLADFGAAGDGVTNDTKALQRAIDQLYLNSDKTIPSARKKLRFPAGTYLITGTIYIPSYATLEGDGIDRTIIKQSTTATAIFQTIDFASTPSNKITFDSIPGIQGVTQPQNIKVSGMTLQFDSNTKQGTSAMILADCAKDMTIDSLKFLGLAADPRSDDQIAVAIRGYGATTTEDLTISNCKFEKLYSPIDCNYDVKRINITKNSFYWCQGSISFSQFLTGVSPQSVGPVGVKITENYFNFIGGSAVSIFPNSSNTSNEVISERNRYNDVGNDFSQNNDDEQDAPVIYFGSPNNQSIDDWFSRAERNNTGSPNPMIQEVAGHAYLKPKISNSLTLTVVSFPQPILTTAKYLEIDEQIVMDYVAQQPSLGVTRVGQIRVLASSNTATVTDSFQYSGASSLTGDIRFSASYNSSTNALIVSVLNPLGSVDTNLAFNYSKLF